MERGIAPGIAPGILSGFTRPASGVQYATWTNLTNMSATSAGVTKTGGTDGIWDASARSVETMSGDGSGVQSPYLPLEEGKRVMLSLMDSSGPTGTNYGVTGAFGMLQVFSSGRRIWAYYGTTLVGVDAIVDVSAEAICEIRQRGGAVEIVVDGVVGYTFAETPHESMAARVATIHLGFNAEPIILTGSWS